MLHVADHNNKFMIACLDAVKLFVFVLIL